MPKEIERKFLVASDNWRKKADSGRHIRQAVVFSDGDRTLRIRAIDGRKARLTLKIGISGMTRHEFEYDVPLTDADEMLKLANGNTISKTRYEVRHAKHTWEIDVYDGHLTGLVVAEVELGSEDEKPELPSWVGKEVTGDRRYSNQALAEISREGDWRDGIQD